MELRRSILTKCKGNPQLQKAVAIALCIKNKLGRSSMMRDYSINKLHELTGISASTLKKYIPVLIKYGWVQFVGKDKQHLIICKIVSHTDKRNMNIDKFCFDSFTEIYRSLRAFIVLIIQANKDFVKRTIQTVTDPKDGKSFEVAKKLVKRLVKQGILNGRYEEYKEYGLSYKRIAQETGNCIKTAQKIIQYAINKNWTTKHNNFEQIYAFGVNHREIKGYTFSTKNNLYVIHANTYTLNDAVKAVILDGIC